MNNYASFYQRSLNEPDAFWAEQAGLIDWQVKPTQICDYSKPPFANWYQDGQTNLCHNAVDRHLKDRANQAALIYVSTETGVEVTYSFAQLSDEVQRMAAILQGIGKRVEAGTAWCGRRYLLKASPDRTVAWADQERAERGLQVVRIHCLGTVLETRQAGFEGILDVRGHDGLSLAHDRLR